MIDAKDLRIGNWVKFLNKTFQVGAGTIEDCQKANDSDSPYKYEPIPLTPEILEKCGFERGIIFINRGLELQIDFYKNRIDARITLLDNFDGDKGADIIEIKYLHDLQNLYYALTKQELNY